MSTEAAYFHPGFGLSAAGLAYFPLLLLGIVSFVLAARGPGGARTLIGWRLFVWLPLALLSLMNVRGIAFFAIVAGPVTALNLADAAGRSFPAGLPLGCAPLGHRRPGRHAPAGPDGGAGHGPRLAPGPAARQPPRGLGRPSRSFPGTDGQAALPPGASRNGWGRHDWFPT